ncbi:ATP-binding cassette domain-containing protein [Saccharopolyspora rhizosphaerae]|uniref:ATP-binding cassette domain-containing protein n=1 Tax=Saccharopolyspora rhizosphaerae TaxID=2492662 RepID=A0A3R8VGX8_9PSEU|nr:ATP-binding cassette domain-containing protein [Saccharopolyspora rhizosphaerae]RRO17270.1 ATP-binding cassette domain-containing protein [Saccharopolyspora rhizosphaerae]
MYVLGAGILARGIAVRGPRGVVFANLDFRVEPGSLTVVAGPSGSGRTSLLLVLSGRLRTITGELDVDGLPLPRKARMVRKLIRPARIRPGCELEERHRVREAITERRLISGTNKASVELGLELVGLDVDRSLLIGELPPEERLLLAVGLAAAPAPAGIVVDDVEAGLTQSGRARVWAALHEVSRIGMTVIASSTDRPAGDVDVVRLPAGRSYDPTAEIPLPEKVGR